MDKIENLEGTCILECLAIHEFGVLWQHPICKSTSLSILHGGISKSRCMSLNIQYVNKSMNIVALLLLRGLFRDVNTSPSPSVKQHINMNKKIKGKCLHGVSSISAPEAGRF